MVLTSFSGGIRKEMGLPRWLRDKEFTCQCKRHGFNPWVRKIPWRRKWQPTPVFLPGKSHGQRSLGLQKVRHDLAAELTVFLLISL